MEHLSLTNCLPIQDLKCVEIFKENRMYTKIAFSCEEGFEIDSLRNNDKLNVVLFEHF